MPQLTDAQLRAAARAKVDRALSLIESAQNQLADACAQLSALNGGIPVWTACHKLTDKVHDFWYRVDGFRSGGKYSLDSTNVAALQKQVDAAAAATSNSAEARS